MKVIFNSHKFISLFIIVLVLNVSLQANLKKNKLPFNVQDIRRSMKPYYEQPSLREKSLLYLIPTRLSKQPMKCLLL